MEALHGGMPKVGGKATPNQVGFSSETRRGGLQVLGVELAKPTKHKSEVGKGEGRYIGALQSDFGVWGQYHVLEVDVGADQHVVEEENLSFLRLDELPPVAVHRLCQRLAEEELPLPRAQQLRRGRSRQDGAQPEGSCKPPAPKFGLFFPLVQRFPSSREHALP